MSATTTAPAPAGAPSSTNKETPWLGILAVLLGVFTSVLVGQMLSVGLSDLEGALHLTKDQGAWLGPAYNAGQMFIGPLTVYLGGLLSPRKVLLITAPVAFVSALAAPFMPGFAGLLVALTLLGLACGSFYPLTLSYVARSLPPKLVLFGVSTYAFDVLGTLHLSGLLEGLAMQYLSWRWLFWISTLFTGPMWLCVYRGMPEAASNVNTKELRPTWSGFLYISLGLSTLFLLLTQGDRLDWWRSGVIVALLMCGCLFLIAGIVQHFIRPNPLVRLGALMRRNMLLLSVTLCVLRFSLLSSALIVPQFLGSVRALLPIQSGAVLAWVALPALVFAIAAALSLLKLDPRLLLATGFSLICISCILGRNLSSSWSRGNFITGELLLGVGAAIAVCGLIGSIVLELVNSGIIKNPIVSQTCVAWFHTMRLFGGQVMTTLLTHLISERSRFHTNVLGGELSRGSYIVNEQLRAIAHALAGSSSTPKDAAALAESALGIRVQVQALTLTFQDAFTVEALVLVFALIVIALMRREPLQLRDLAKQRKNNG